MGSRSKLEQSYIAGFLDGDGSLMLQVKKRKDSKAGIRFMATICFYQDSRHDKTLAWIRRALGIGYLSRRNDGMTELRDNGYAQVRDILEGLLPYIRFKRIQAKALLSACNILSGKTITTLKKKDMRRLIDLLIRIQEENYATKHKKTREELFRVLGLTP